jgi:hypothetical protein
LSLFSIEFQHRFHIKPSVMLRSTRDSQGLHGATQDDGEHNALAARRLSLLHRLPASACANRLFRAHLP